MYDMLWNSECNSDEVYEVGYGIYLNTSRLNSNIDGLEGCRLDYCDLLLWYNQYMIHLVDDNERVDMIR